MNMRTAVPAVVAVGVMAATVTTTAVAATHTRPHATTGVPTTMTAAKIYGQPDTLKQGARLSAKQITNPRVFATAKDGLAIGADDQGTDYAAVTTNGGASWTVASPALFTATADAPNAVQSVTTAGKVNVVYGANSIDTNTSGSGTWYRVYSEGWITAVVQGLHGIAAYVQVNNSQGVITGVVQYVSTNGGRTWKLSNVAGG
jgi:hypothetical protein